MPAGPLGTQNGCLGMPLEPLGARNGCLGMPSGPLGAQNGCFQDHYALGTAAWTCLCCHLVTKHMVYMPFMSLYLWACNILILLTRLPDYKNIAVYRSRATGGSKWLLEHACRTTGCSEWLLGHAAAVILQPNKWFSRLPASWAACQPVIASLQVNLPACLPACEPAYQPFCQTACQLGLSTGPDKQF